MLLLKTRKSAKAHINIGFKPNKSQRNNVQWQYTCGLAKTNKEKGNELSNSGKKKKKNNGQNQNKPNENKQKTP